MRIGRRFPWQELPAKMAVRGVVEPIISFQKKRSRIAVAEETQSQFQNAQQQRGNNDHQRQASHPPAPAGQGSLRRGPRLRRAGWSIPGSSLALLLQSQFPGRLSGHYSSIENRNGLPIQLD